MCAPPWSYHGCLYLDNMRFLLAWKISEVFSLFDNSYHWCNRITCGELYDHACLFFIDNLRYLCYKGREEVLVDDNISVLFEFKSWWWRDDINLSIFHVILMQLTTLFVTQLLPIAIGVDHTFGSEVRIHYCKLVWIVMVGSTPSSDLMSTSSSYLTSEYLVTASSSSFSIKFGYIVCLWEIGLSGKRQVSGYWCWEMIIVVLKWLFRIIKEFQGWVIRNRITDGIFLFNTTLKLSNFLFFRTGIQGDCIG